jgi:glycosyltransferase involved in cell wall biosynthesis
MRVLVAHPTRQHSHRLAAALQEAGQLNSYWTLLPEGRSFSWLPTFLKPLIPSAVQRHSLEFLPSDKVHCLVGPLLSQKVSSKTGDFWIRLLGEWFAWAVFDHWVARKLKIYKPDVVVGYEMCCSETFRVAKDLGITCVLDAAAVHYRAQERLLGEDKVGTRTWAGRRLRARKEREIDYSDTIICVSELAESSYIEAGIDDSRIFLNPVGCDTENFVPTESEIRVGPAKFIFVGLPVYHKGFDILMRSYDRLLAYYPESELHLVGDELLARDIIGGRSINSHGKLSHDELGSLFVQMDCLVLPSRLESFGMVVVEALAVGVPVIVSDHAGAAQAITEDVNGWLVVAGSEESLFERMVVCCEDIDKLRAMKSACAQSASDYDWSKYSKRTTEIFSRLLPDSRSN